MAEEKIEGHGRYFKKNLFYIYIYSGKWVCAVRKQIKKNKLVFSKRRKHSVRRGKTNSSKENFLI